MALSRSIKKTALVLCFNFLILTSAFAQTYEIYTYNSGDFLASIFDGMKMLIAGGHIKSLIKVFLIVGLIMGVLAPLIRFFGGHRGGSDASFHGAEGLLALIKTALFGAVAVYVLMIPRANVAIIDRADPSQTQVVSDVPFVNAFVAHVSSRIGDIVGAELEDVITPVDAVRFRRNGVAIGAKYLNEILDIMPPGAPAQYGDTNNVSIAAVLGEYFERCVFPNFAYIPGSNSEAALGLRILQQSPEILYDLSAIGGPFRDPNKSFNINFDESTPLTCATAVTHINYYWNSIFNNWLKQVNYKLLGGNPDDEGYLTTVQEIFERYFPYSAGDFRDQIKQLAVLNSVRYALISYAAKHGDHNIKDMLTSHKVGSGWIEAGRLFNKIVQTMRMLIEGIIYGVSVFLPVFFAIAGVGAIVTFVKVNLWLQMWVPFYVLLNAFADWQFASVIKDALYNPAVDPNFYGISFETVEAVRSHANLILGYIGAFTWSIPPLAWGLIKGGEYAVTHAVSAIASGSGGQTVAQQVGAEVGGASNVSIGQRNLGGFTFMGSTSIGSQAHMLQGLTLSSAIRQVVQSTGGSVVSAIERMGGGQAVDIAKQIGRGETYGGNLPRAMAVAGIGETRMVADMETFKGVSSSYGGVEGFQSAIAEKDYTRVGTVIGDYADRKGISIHEASRQLGSLMGTRELIGTHAFENAMGVVGKSGLELTETQKTLNEAAKMEQMYRVARALGFAVSRDDFRGMFQEHLAHHAEETMTVPSQDVADRLNQMAKDQGLRTRFYPGDRVRMAWKDDIEKGMIFSLMKGESGASSEFLDLTKSVKGLQEWAGRESQYVNLVTQRGVLGTEPGMFNARDFVGLLRASGADHVTKALAADIGKGKQVFLEYAHLDPNTGKLAAFGLQRGGEMEIEDHVETELGWKTLRRGINISQYGSISTVHDESKSTFVRGPHTDPSSMWSAAVAGDRTLARRVLDAPTNKLRNQEMDEQAVKFAQASAARLSKEGILISYSQFSGSAGGSFGGSFKLFGSSEIRSAGDIGGSSGLKGGLLGFNLGGSAGIGHRNTEQETYDRIYRDIKTAQSDLLGRLNRKEITKEDFEKQYANIFQNYSSEVNRLIQEKGDDKFGASGVVTRPFGSDKLGKSLQQGARDWKGAWGQGLFDKKE